MTTHIYRSGVQRDVVVRNTAAGDWEVLDTSAGENRVIESLDASVDGEPQAEAVARDYVAAGRFTAAAGRNGDEAIPEQGGADAHSDRRLRSAACSKHAREAALPRQTG